MNKKTLPDMSSAYEQMARSVVQAHREISSQNTSPTGTISVHRSNGTKDIYGVLNKDGYSVAKNVGDTVAPPKPKGIFSTSSSDVVYVAWDGTLEDKIPSDFYNVTIYMGVNGQSSVMGTLTEPGIVSTPPLPTAQSIEVWATAEDDTCEEDGTPAHNVSPESAHQNVTIQHGSNSQGVEELKKLIEKKVDAIEAKAEQAIEAADNTQKVVEELNNSFSHDSEGSHVGSKTGMHTTINAQGMLIKKNNAEVASFFEHGVKLSSGDLRITSGFIRDFGYNSTAFSSSVFDFEAENMVYIDSPKVFLRTMHKKNGGFEGTDIDIMPDQIGVSSHHGAGSINTADLVKLMKFVPWTDLVNNQWVRVRYCVRSGFMYLDCWMTGGYPTYTTPTQIPDNLLPEKAGYYPLATQQGNNTAKMWLGAAGGGDGHVYLYNHDSGYCSGVVPVIPKSLE